MQVHTAVAASKMTITIADRGVLRLVTDALETDRATRQISEDLLGKMFPAALDAPMIAEVNSRLDLNGALINTGIAGIESCLLVVDGPIEHSPSFRAHGAHISVIVGLALSPEMEGAHELLENFHLPPKVINETVNMLIDELMTRHGAEFGLFDRTGWLRDIALKTDGAWEPVAFQTEEVSAGVQALRRDREMDLALPGTAMASGTA